MSAEPRGVRWCGPDGEGTAPVTATEAATGRAIAASVLGLLGGLGLTALTLLCWHTAQTVRGPATLNADLEVSVALNLLVLGAAGLTSLWLGLLLLLGAVAALPGRLLAPLRRTVHVLAPRLAPRVAAALVTATVSLVPLGAAHAQEPVTASQALLAPSGGATESLSGGHAAGWGTQLGFGPAATGSVETRSGETGSDVRQPDSQAPEPGWAPTAPPTRADPDRIGLVSRGGMAPDTVVVRAGDTLWDVAARHLGADVDASEIAAAWPRWYEANRAVIGADPHLILPGTELVPPASMASVGSGQ